MNSKQTLVRLAVLFIFVFAFYRVQREAVIFAHDLGKPRASTLKFEHTVCNPRVLMEVLKMSNIKGVSIQRKYSNNSDVATLDKTLKVNESKHASGATIPTNITSVGGKFDLKPPKFVTNYSDSSLPSNRSKSDRRVISRQTRVIDTTRWGRKPGNWNNQGKLNWTSQQRVFTATHGQLKPVIYVRSIHPMHIDLKTHVRRKIEEGVDIEVLPINPHPFNYIHSPPECDFEATSDGFNLIILVKSSVQHFALRDSIRKTWGNMTNISNVKVVFLVAFKQSAQTDIDNEAARFSDIIQENFIDAYKNNTLKTIMGFNWPVDKCSQADVLFFVDDDHIVRITNVIAYLRTFNKIEMKKLYAGFRIDKPPVDRRDGSPWSMSNYDFSHVLWPAYLRGGAFTVTSEIAQRFVIAFPYVKLLSVDDSYLGIVADKLGMLPQHDRRFKMDKVNITVCPDYFVYNDYKDPQEIKSVWKTISKELAAS